MNKREQLQAKKKKRRQQRKKDLNHLSAKRQQERGALDFGAKEGDILAIKQQVQKLTIACNALTAEVENYRKTNLVGKVEETYYQVGVLAKILVDANLIDKEEYQERCRQSQMSSIGLKDKGPDAEVEQGDTMIMSYKIYDDSLPATAENPEKVVDDKGNEKLAYVVGSNGLPCDEGMVGMKLGEARYFDVTFGEKSAKKEFVGKNLRMLVMCRGIKIKTGADDQSQVLQSA